MEQLAYYAYLAATVPPATLARSAARKLARRASQALGMGRPLADHELLEAFCAEGPEDLALKLAAPRASFLWADASQREEIAGAVQSGEGWAERAVARAEAAWRREFAIFGVPARFGRGPAGIDWHYDALHGGRFEPDRPAFDTELWRPGLDPKAPWALARFDQGIALGLGVWLTTLEEARARYASEFVFQLRQFVRDNPPGMGVNWSSPMEIALRAANLCLAYVMMRHRPELQDPGFALDLARALAAHGRFVVAHLEHTQPVPNNHYVANLVGLLHLGVVFPELPGARRWRERAVEGLKEEIERQVLADGFSFEGSTSYHRLSTELFTLALLAARSARIELGPAYERRLHLMYRAAALYLGPTGLAPQIGDNDSGRAVLVRERPALDQSYLLPLGAALFEDPDLKPIGSRFCEEALLLTGRAGFERFERLPESMPGRSGSLPHAGLYVLRSGEAWCAVSCGSTGQQGIGGHGHLDKLGVEIHAGAGPIVVDTGSYCYTSHPTERNAFRGTAAHSTVQIDGLEQGRLLEGRLFALPDETHARMVRFESSPGRERFVGAHRGYERLVPPVHVEREVRYERAARCFLVLDRVEGEGAHEVLARFHLPDREARLREPTAAERERLERLGPLESLDLGRAVELGPRGRPRALLVACRSAGLGLLPARYSPGYGERVDSYCVGVRQAAQLPLELVVAILLL